jgi:hypothetical protein
MSPRSLPQAGHGKQRYRTDSPIPFLTSSLFPDFIFFLSCFDKAAFSALSGKMAGALGWSRDLCNYS